jgi:hypothetical protein
MHFFPANLDKFCFYAGFLDLIQGVPDEPVRVAVLMGTSIESDDFHSLPLPDLSAPYRFGSQYHRVTGYPDETIALGRNKGRMMKVFSRPGTMSVMQQASGAKSIVPGTLFSGIAGTDGTVRSRSRLAINGIAYNCFVNGSTGEIVAIN